MLMRMALIVAFAASAVSAQDRPVVATVNYPLAWMAQRLGGDAVDVFYAVPEGQDPTFWRPGLADIAAIQQADVIALNGAGFAAWTARTSLPRSRLVDTSAAFLDAYNATQSVTHSHGADGEHSHTGTASYTWLDFTQAAQQAEALANAMQRRMPDLRSHVEASLPTLLDELRMLDAETREALLDLRGATILATHPRYQYFARAYGLEIAALDWEAGAMSDEAQWQDLQTLAAQTSATLLLWEASPPPEAMDRVEELGLKSVVFAPLASQPESGEFISVMRAQIAALVADR